MADETFNIQVRENVLKCAVGKFNIYNREWLMEHLEQEFELLRKEKIMLDAMKKRQEMQGITRFEYEMRKIIDGKKATMRDVICYMTTCCNDCPLKGTDCMNGETAESFLGEEV